MEATLARRNIKDHRFAASARGGTATPALAATLLVLASCSHPLDREYQPRFQVQRAREMLAATDIAGARSEYQAVLRADPMNADAAFGWAVTDLLLLPDAQPVSDVLDRCNQPHLDLSARFFGPNGVLAQAAAASAGAATLRVVFRPNQDAGASAVDFAPKSVVTAPLQYQGPEGISERWVNVAARERGGRHGALFLSINPDDVMRGDETTTPLAANVVIDLSRLDGSASFSEPVDPAAAGPLGEVEFVESDRPLSGQLVVKQFGPAPGDPIELELVDAVLPSWCVVPPECSNGGCGRPVPCHAAYEVSGTISDTLTLEPSIDASTLPFGDIHADDRAPFRDAFTVALERCSPFDTEFLAGELRRVGDVLAAESASLGVVLESPLQDRFSFSIPGQLLQSSQDLPVNLADVRALKAMIDAASAGAELFAQYQYLRGSVQALIEEDDQWVDTSSAPQLRRARSISLNELVMNLNTGFFTPDSRFDLTTFRTRLDAAIRGSAAALRQGSAQPGLLQFQALPARRLAGELADMADAIERSIASDAPQTVASAPGFAVHLQAFFAHPLDARRLEQLSGIAPLFGVRRGDPSAPYAAERNSAVDFLLADEFDRRDDIGLVSTWTGGVVIVPPDRRSTSCADSSTCGDGHLCSSAGRCELATPWVATDGAWAPVTGGDWPIVLNPILRDILQF